MSATELKRLQTTNKISQPINLREDDETKPAVLVIYEGIHPRKGILWEYLGRPRHQK